MTGCEAYLPGGPAGAESHCTRPAGHQRDPELEGACFHHDPETGMRWSDGPIHIVPSPPEA